MSQQVAEAARLLDRGVRKVPNFRVLTRADVDRYKMNGLWPLSEEEMRWVQSNFSSRRAEPRFARLLDREALVRLASEPMNRSVLEAHNLRAWPRRSSSL